MMRVRLRRVINTSVNTIKRNPWFAFASMTTMTLTLITVASFFMMTVLIHSAAEEAKKKVGVATVNLKDWVTPKEAQKLSEKIKSVVGVEDVEYVTKEEAVANFKKTHKDDPLLLDAVSEENPLFNSLEVRVKDPKDFEQVKALLDDRDAKAMVHDFSFEGDREDTIIRIRNVSNFVQKLGIFLSFLFVLVASLIIFNTVRLGIYSRKTEVEIMHLNGATSGYIRAPFLLEGVIYGLVATVFTTLLFLGLILSLDDSFVRYFGEVGNLKNIVFVNLPLFAGSLLVVGMGVGLFSSSLAVNKHLNVK